MQLGRQRGFSLVELAVVFAIVALLIGGAMMTLSAQVEQRNADETMRRLNAAADAVLAFAIVNKRLPCPARFVSTVSHSQGLESFCAAGAPATCVGTGPSSCGRGCSSRRLLPAVAVGATPLDPQSFAVDAWGNRLRYAVARATRPAATAPPANTRVFTCEANLKPTAWPAARTAWMCARRPLAPPAWSHADRNKLFPTAERRHRAAYGADELENTDADARFVSRTTSAVPRSAPSTIQWWWCQSASCIRLIAAGVLLAAGPQPATTWRSSNGKQTSPSTLVSSARR
jgi:prepilin-type N-terminal cleavage/methylation domain-containing protein